MKASVQSFTGYNSANEYLSACMKTLTQEGNPPKCLIRIDRSHFVRSIHSNKIPQKLEGRVSRLVKGVIGYLIICDSMQSVKSVLSNLFVLTKNRMGTEDVIAAQKYLAKIVQMHKFDETSAANSVPNDDKSENESDMARYRDTLV